MQLSYMLEAIKAVSHQYNGILLQHIISVGYNELREFNKNLDISDFFKKYGSDYSELEKVLLTYGKTPLISFEGELLKVTSSKNLNKEDEKYLDELLSIDTYTKLSKNNGKTFEKVTEIYLTVLGHIVDWKSSNYEAIDLVSEYEFDKNSINNSRILYLSQCKGHYDYLRLGYVKGLIGKIKETSIYKNVKEQYITTIMIFSLKGFNIDCHKEYQESSKVLCVSYADMVHTLIKLEKYKELKEMIEEVRKK